MQAIISVSSNNVIGKGDGLPWLCKSDLAFFRCMTLGKTCHVGYRTYQSLKHLKDRSFYVIDRDNPPKYDPCAIVIGGADTYKRYMDLEYIDVIFYTMIYANVKGDVMAPDSITLDSLMAKNTKWTYEHWFSKQESDQDQYLIFIHRFEKIG